ncbi:50S ribosomal protein L11 methyltransferase [Hoeflea sp. CAU 1731]
MAQNLVTGYSLLSYGGMVTNAPRMEPYAKALESLVTSESIVLDIGAGSGIFSLLACRFGAKAVVAIEPQSAIEIAKTTAQANGYLDRFTFYKGLSTDFKPEAQADIIVSDIRGVLPFFQSHISSIVDARERLLKPSGCLIPRADTVMAAIVDAPDTFKKFESPWISNEYGLDLSPGYKYVINSWIRVNLKEQDLLSLPQRFARLDYHKILDPNVMNQLCLKAERDGTAHGFCLWFDSELTDSIGFSSAPGQPELIYGQAFFPFEDAISMQKGDEIEISMKANLIDNDYVYSWNWQVRSRDDKAAARSGRQSTFLSNLLTRSALERTSADHVPQLGAKAEIDLACLELVDGVNSMGEISKAVAARFPDHFGSWQEVLKHLSTLTERYRQTE